jgi:hypothetical protein
MSLENFRYFITLLREFSGMEKFTSVTKEDTR